MKLIKECLNAMDYDIIVDGNQKDELNEDKLIIKDLIEELLFKIDKQSATTRLIGRRNKDEIIISSDESSEEEDVDINSNKDKNEDANSDNESFDLDKCLTRLKPLKTKGEFLIEELPAPEEETIQLTININQLQQIGNVNKIIDNLIIVESFKSLPALDIDSVLFFRDGKSIGRVFDVIGLVCRPHYIIRFASSQSIELNSIFINMPVYFVLSNLTNHARYQDLTKFVLISQLKGVKGTDASWENNNEPPENVKEYSDDEEERKDQLKSKAKRKNKNNNNLHFNDKRPNFNNKNKRFNFNQMQ